MERAPIGVAVMERAPIGVLALQGGFAAHLAAIEASGRRAVEVRCAADLGGLGALVMPGGESTVQLKLLERLAMEAPLRAFIASGRPVLATCAGLILLAQEVTGPAQPSLGALDVTVARNAWGRQRDSFEATSDEGAIPLVFIRAPRIVRVGADVTVMATFRGEPVMVRQGNVTGATFHPELTAWRDAHAALAAAA